MTKEIGAALLSLSSFELTLQEKELIKTANPLGFCFFGRNIQNQTQLRGLTHEISDLLQRDDVIFAIDQEGGRVRRLHEPEFNAYASQQTIGRLYTETSPDAAKKAAQLHAELISQDLKDCGINMNLAPVLDIGHKETTAAVASRCFSSSATIVSELGKIMVNEYIKNGIIPCIKHLPGHGRAAVDPHLALPLISQPLEKLEEDFTPFKKLNDCPCGMTAHVIVKKIDSENPITLSPSGIKELIRKHIGFNGFLFSDAIEMHALSGSLSSRGQKSLDSGCDAYCYSRGDINELKELCSQLPPLRQDSKARFASMKKILKNKTSNTNKDARHNYESLLNNIIPYEESYDSTLVLMQMNK